MSTLVLSEAEKAYIVAGVEDDFRTDGRSNEDFRTINIQTGIVSNTNGSAQVKISGTNVIVGVKAEIGQVMVDTPYQGRMEFFVDCSANASPIFEGRGGDDLAQELSKALERTFCTGAVDLSSLCVISGKCCWILYVDAVPGVRSIVISQSKTKRDGKPVSVGSHTQTGGVERNWQLLSPFLAKINRWIHGSFKVLECGGNLFDALSMGIKAALYDTRIPDLKIIGEGKEQDYIVSDDPYDYSPIDITSVPLLVTLNKIGNRFVVDATAEEEVCTDAQLLVSINERGNTCSVQKLGKSGFHPDLLFEMMQVGQGIGVKLNEKLMILLQKELSQDKT